MSKLWELIYIASVYGGIVGIILVLIKQLLKDKINAKWGYLIWSILILKLLVPYGPQSDISIFNNLNFKDNYINYENNQVINKENLIKDNYNSSNLNKHGTENNTEITINEKFNLEDTTSTQTKQDISMISSIEKYIPYAWMIGFLIVALIFISSHILLHKKLNINKPETNNHLYYILQNCRNRMGINSNIAVIETDFVSTPSVIGILSPKILIPSSMMNLTEKELEYVFLHELAHYKRKDTLINYFLLVLQAIHWFNPVVWYCFKHIREDMEYATDEKVLLVLKEKENNDYGKAILTVLERVNYSRFEPSIIGIID
ncbi:MAG: M56 family metallopeptidase, partial [Peptostreptococcaceae bacterium]